MYILGISALYHDSAACLIKDGEIIAAAQEERFTRVKSDSSLPKHSIRFCLEYEGISIGDISHVVYYEKPFLKFDRILHTYFQTAPFGFISFIKSFPIWIKDKLFLKVKIKRFFKDNFDFDTNAKNDFLLFTDHHRSHAASAYYPSPFEESLIITIDGVGEWPTCTISIGKGHKIEKKEEINFPSSLGLLYSAFTYFLGFKVNSGEYKVMGLAPYGEPKYADTILNNLVDLKSDGSFCLNMKFFNFLTGLKMTGRKFEDIFGIKRRIPESEITQEHADLAASLQKVSEIIVLHIVKYAKNKYAQENLCLAGGVALNCVINGKIFQELGFNEIWVQPASGDAGGSVGAALDVHHNLYELSKKKSDTDSMKSAFLGSEYSDLDIENELTAAGLQYHKFTDDQLVNRLSDLLINKNIVAIFRGRMEFGPRSLGNRSILAMATDLSLRSQINQKIKFRESFRPFAPIMLPSELKSLFGISKPMPYMLFTFPIKDEYRNPINRSISNLHFDASILSAVTHMDYSARVQTVNSSQDLLLKLLEDIKLKTSYGVLVNTSFNMRGEPIVESPKDAINTFLKTNIDVLLLNNYLVIRTENDLREVVKPKDLVLD